MEPWLLFTFGAATAQTARFMLQKQLKTAGLSNGGATFARFVYSAPLVGLGLWLYTSATGHAPPALNARFWTFAVTGGLAQILATICVVALFSYRNFAVGITFKKSEVILTALAGFLVLGERLNSVGALAIGLGLIGVLLLSDPPGGSGHLLRRVANPAAGLGILSGVFFAVSAVGYSGATRALGEEDLVLRAALTLFWATAVQTLVLGAWLRWREPGEIMRVFSVWRVSALVGLTSMIGSFCWFSAFALQNVAYVFAVGQIEVILSIAATALFFREPISGREYGGMAVLTASILILVLAL